MEFVRCLIAGLLSGISGCLPVPGAGILRIFGLAGTEGNVLGNAALYSLGTGAAILLRMRRYLGRGVRTAFGALRGRQGSGTNRRRLFLLLTGLVFSVPVTVLLGGMAVRGEDSLPALGGGCFITAILLVVAERMMARGGSASEHPYRKTALAGIAVGCGALPAVSDIAAGYGISVMCGSGRRSAAYSVFLLKAFTGIALFIRVLTLTGNVSASRTLYLIAGNLLSFLAAYLLFPAARKMLVRLRPSVFAAAGTAAGIVLIVMYLAGH